MRDSGGISNPHEMGYIPKVQEKYEAEKYPRSVDLPRILICLCFNPLQDSSRGIRCGTYILHLIESLLSNLLPLEKSTIGPSFSVAKRFPQIDFFAQTFFVESYTSINLLLV